MAEEEEEEVEEEDDEASIVVLEWEDLKWCRHCTVKRSSCHRTSLLLILAVKV